MSLLWPTGPLRDKAGLSVDPLPFPLREYGWEWPCLGWRCPECSLCLSLPGRAPPCSPWRSDETLILILSSSLLAAPFSARDCWRRDFLELDLSLRPSPGWGTCCGCERFLWWWEERAGSMYMSAPCSSLPFCKANSAACFSLYLSRVKTFCGRAKGGGLVTSCWCLLLAPTAALCSCLPRE